MINNSGFKLADKDIFVIFKILLESRAFSEYEIDKILNILNISMIYSRRIQNKMKDIKKRKAKIEFKHQR